MNQSLNFCFKGNRTYVHGTDIVSELYKNFSQSEVTNVDIKFNGIALTNLDLVEGDELENAKVNIRLTEKGTDKHFQLIESSTEIDCRYEYDEDDLLNKCNLDLQNEQISLKEKTGYTFCENLVAMNKSLLQSLFPDESGKWYFTRLEQPKMVVDEALIKVKLVKNFNFRLVKSDILMNDTVIGSVYFTMVRG